MSRILLAALVGGVVSFGWGALSHMVLHIGDGGIRFLENEAAVTAPMAGKEAGAYFFPYYDQSKGDDPESPEWKAWEEAYRRGPVGVVIWDPQGKEPMGPQQFGVEFAAGTLCCLIMALVVSWSRCSFRGRWLTCILLGVLCWLATPVPFWNWYGFPADFILMGTLADLIGTAAIAGAAVAAIARPCEESCG